MTESNQASLCSSAQRAILHKCAELHISLGAAFMSEMPKLIKFKKGDRAFVQAQQVWLTLVGHVMFAPDNRQRPLKEITYGELAERMGRPTQAGRNLRVALGIVGDFCSHNNLPTLNSFVVNKDDLEAGGSVVVRKGSTARKERAAALKINWLNFRIPTTGRFRTVWEIGKKLREE